MRHITELRGTSKKLADMVQEVIEHGYARDYNDCNDIFELQELNTAIRGVVETLTERTGITFDDSFIREEVREGIQV